MVSTFRGLALTALLAGQAVNVAAYTTYREDVELLHSGRPQVKLWQTILEQRKSEALQASQSNQPGSHQQEVFNAAGRRTGASDSSEDLLGYTPHCFYQPLDHFDPENPVTFCQRYWVSLEHWDSKNNSSPVYVLDGGETSGANRLPFLDTGILNILANATGGISIVLEHRYYGHSLPNISYPSGDPFSLSTDDLRFLTSEQALMDTVRLVQNLDLTTVDKRLSSNKLSHTKRPWIAYGGSYAGAMTAFLVKGWGYENGTMLDSTPPPHPAIPGQKSTKIDSNGLVWGGIASSAVTHAQINYPEYFQAIQEWAPDECMRTLETATDTIDFLLELQDGKWRKMVQGLFGLENLEHVEDFGDVLLGVLSGWQGRNWDPTVGTDEFYRFCDALTAAGPVGSADIPISIDSSPLKIPVAILNYAGYVKKMVQKRCPDGDVETCYGSFDPEPYKQTGLDQKWRLWLFQVCENWGYFMPAPLEGKRIVSKFVNLEHSSKICKVAYPAGKYFKLPAQPDVERVNARGDFALEASRIAFIDGDSDPWRPATPQSDYAVKRKSSLNKPVYMIEDAVHHFDENGLLDSAMEPKRIRAIHKKEIEFVKAWLREWDEQKVLGRV